MSWLNDKLWCTIQRVGVGVDKEMKSSVQDKRDRMKRPGHGESLHYMLISNETRLCAVTQ